MLVGVLFGPACAVLVAVGVAVAVDELLPVGDALDDAEVDAFAEAFFVGAAVVLRTEVGGITGARVCCGTPTMLLPEEEVGFSVARTDATIPGDGEDSVVPVVIATW